MIYAYFTYSSYVLCHKESEKSSIYYTFVINKSRILHIDTENHFRSAGEKLIGSISPSVIVSKAPFSLPR